MESRTCAADDCHKSFTPSVDWEKFCSRRCANRIRVRNLRERERQRHRRPDPPPPGGPPNGNGGGLYATVGGAVEYGGDGSASDKNVYSVKSDRRKPPKPIQADQPPERIHPAPEAGHAAAA
jgi:hypothetical protein